jgi:hypothetical protein
MSEQIVTRSAVIHLNGAPAEVFPLFTAVGEYQWIPGWNPELIYPPSGEPMRNNVFATRHGDSPKTIWVTVDYDTAALHVEYVNVTPESHVQRVEIQCRPASDGTEAQVTYTRIATAEAGSAVVEAFSESAYTEMMQHWQAAINHYLAHHTLIHAL